MKRIALAATLSFTLGAILLGPLGLGRSTVGGSGIAHAAPLVLSDEHAIADVADKVMPSVVNVSTTTVMKRSSFGFDLFGDGDGEQLGNSLGSGVIVSSKGFVLTNNHVIANARDIKVSTSDGSDYEAEVVGADPKSDLAVLRLKGKVKGLVALPLGDSSKLRLGDIVLAVGNPFGVGQTLTMGIVSAKGRANMGIVDYEDFIQTDAAINPGNSGGALVNMHGELVGINTAILSRTGGSQGIGFAIPTDMARPIMESLISHGKVVRGWLGVSIQDVSHDLADTLALPTTNGVLITDVASGSPAAKAGLARGDVVVAVAGKKTAHAAQLRNAVASLGAGRAVDVEFLRGKDTRSAHVVLAQQPEQGMTAQNGGQPMGKPDKLGVTVAPVSPSTRNKYSLPKKLDHGVVVTSVKDGSLAAEIGLEAGDVILEVNRTSITSAKQLESLYRKAPNRLAVLVYRNGAAVYLMIQK